MLSGCSTRDALTAFHADYRSRSEVLDANANMSPYTITVTGDLEKPNRVNSRLTHGGEFIGQIICDGHTETCYDAKSNSYAQCPAIESHDTISIVDIARQKLAEDEPGYKRPEHDPIAEHKTQVKAEEEAFNVFGSRPGISDAVSAAEFLLASTSGGDFNELGMALGGITRKRMLRPGSDREMDVIDMKNSVMDGLVIETHFAFDSISGLPFEYRSVNIMHVPPDPIMRILQADYTYTSIVPISAPFPTSTFTWLPPAGAKLYIKPKEVDPFASTK